MKIKSRIMFFIFMIFYSISGISQVYMSPSFGSNDKIHPTVTLAISYEKAIALQVEQIAVMHLTEPAYWGGRIGVGIFKSTDFEILPAIGYYYKLISLDKVSENKWLPGYFLRLRMNIVFVELCYLDNTQVRIGTRIKFARNYNRYK